ncbi:MAG: SusC/RagA family TonB-linked outer membrane protein, partial [Cyclobacteriaceae bacterium]
MKRLLLFFNIFILSSVIVLAQDNNVTGTIISEVDGSPLPGVNVVVKGTDIGTVTDINGEFSLAAAADATLVISFIGYETTEVSVNNRSVIDIVLEEDVQQLDEIVVTGYGTQTKRDVTGSIATVQGEDIAQVPVGSFDQALQGRAAGVQINRANGEPGAGVRIQVRGTSSISAGTNPLIVIDGLPVTDNTRSGINPLAYINPNDIESIEVLKDAQAAAIYGSRGANGVILVTTKSGKGEGEFNVSYQKGVTSPLNMVDFLGPQDWLAVTDESYNNAGFEGQWDPVEQQVLLSDSALSPTNKNYLNRDRINQFVEDNPDGLDYFAPFWRNGSLDEISVSFNQGFENGSIYASGQYRNEQGLVEGLDFKRYQARLNTAFQPLERLSTGINLNLTYLDNDRIPLVGGGGQLNGGRNDNGRVPNYGVAINNPPILPFYNPDGSLWDILGRRNTQLSALPIYENVNQVFRILGNMYLQYEIFDGLSF